MPTNERIRGTIVEVSERLEDLGYQMTDFVGPVDETGEEISEEKLQGKEPPEAAYYLVSEANGAQFYIMFQTSAKYASIVYPMNALSYLGRNLDIDEIGQILEQDLDDSELTAEEIQELSIEAAKKIVENTSVDQFHTPAFNLSAYASTSLVEYRQQTTDRGFPTEVQCTRGMFPYDEQISLNYLDDRVHPVIIAGERARRYIEYAFTIDKQNKDPIEYTFKSVL